MNTMMQLDTQGPLPAAYVLAGSRSGCGDATLCVPAGYVEMSTTAATQLADELLAAVGARYVQMRDGVAAYRQGLCSEFSSAVVLSVEARPMSCRLAIGQHGARLTPLEAAQFRAGLSAVLAARRRWL